MDQAAKNHGAGLFGGWPTQLWPADMHGHFHGHRGRDVQRHYPRLRLSTESEDHHRPRYQRYALILSCLSICVPPRLITQLSNAVRSCPWLSLRTILPSREAMLQVISSPGRSRGPRDHSFIFPPYLWANVRRENPTAIYRVSPSFMSVSWVRGARRWSPLMTAAWRSRTSLQEGWAQSGEPSRRQGY